MNPFEQIVEAYSANPYQYLCEYASLHGQPLEELNQYLMDRYRDHRLEGLQVREAEVLSLMETFKRFIPPSQ